VPEKREFRPESVKFPRNPWESPRFRGNSCGIPPEFREFLGIPPDSGGISGGMKSIGCHARIKELDVDVLRFVVNILGREVI
jgi:hypothetical protein